MLPFLSVMMFPHHATFFLGHNDLYRQSEETTMTSEDLRSAGVYTFYSNNA